MTRRKKPTKPLNESSRINRGVDANRNEWWDEEDARVIAEQTENSKDSSKSPTV